VTGLKGMSGEHAVCLVGFVGCPMLFVSVSADEATKLEAEGCQAKDVKKRVLGSAKQ
jgi:hypothetical protein